MEKISLEKFLPEKEKFSKEEALFAVEAINRKKGLKSDSSEQASDEDYDEARILLQQLKEKNIDWLEIDWEKVDFNNADSIRDLETQLDEAARKVVESQVEESKDSKGFMNLLNKYEKKLIPIAVALAIILGAGNINIGKVGSNIGKAEASEILPDAEKININTAEKIFKNYYNIDLNNKQAAQITKAYQSVNIGQFKKIIELSSKTMSQGGFSAQQIVDFLIDPEYISNAKEIFAVDGNSAKQESIKKSKAEEIIIPNGKVVINGGDLKLEASMSGFGGSSLLNKTADGKINVKLTDEGRKAYEGRFVNEVQEEQILKKTVSDLANQRYAYFQALESAELSGNKKAVEIIKLKLDEQKQQCEKLYGNIFIK